MIDVLHLLFRNKIALIDTDDEAIFTGKRRIGVVMIIKGLHRC